MTTSTLLAQAPTPPATFKVEKGAAPWSDRVGKWALGEVPANYAGATLPQQNCTSRSLILPEGVQSAVMGVAKKDQDNFAQLYPAAVLLDDVFSIETPAGETMDYVLFQMQSPPTVIKGRFQAGLILIALTPPLNGSSPAPPAPSQASTFEVPGNREKFEIYLLMGQSNMVGRDTSKLNQQDSDPRIGSLEKDDQWMIARDPLWSGTGTGPGMAFAKGLLTARPAGVKIGLVQCAVGGTPLSRWEKGGDLYQRALARARVAAKAGALKGVLWHQGESDSAKPELANSYERRLAKMLADLRADLESPDLPVAVGQLGMFLETSKQPEADVVRAAIEKVAATVPHTALVSSIGLADKGDHLHFSSEAQNSFGQRYASAMLTLQSMP